MRLPSFQEWLFATKTFAAAMLALGIGLAAGLDRPYWAMATVFIASQPLSGATRSKAAFRFMGTLLGATAAVVLVPNLVNSPALLSLALAGWAAGCLTISLLDRTPRSYVFMLAAYTAAIIGFPSVAAPGAIWDTAIARSQEIGLGIICASLVASLVMPRHVGPVVADRTRAWLADGRAWSLAVLDGTETPAAARENRRRLATDAVDLGLIATHLAYDPSQEQQASVAIHALHARMLLLLPVLSSISDRLAGLRQAGGFSPGLRAVLTAMSTWMRNAGAADDLDGERDLRAALARQDAPLQSRCDWPSIMQAGLILRLVELLDLRRDCRTLQAHISARRPGLPALLNTGDWQMNGVQHRDLGMALFSGGSAGLAIMLVCAFWIASGWAEGAIAAEMTAVACCFFAARDNPTPAILGFMQWTIVAIVVDMVYLFAILPGISGFEMLVLALAPTYILFGLLIARPSTTPIGLALAANASTLLSLQETYSADFASFSNAGVATVLGMGVAAVATQLIRSVGAETGFRRMARANWRDLSRAARGRGQGDRALFTTLFLDRLGLAAPRLSAIPAGSDLQDADALAELRIGLNILDLRRARHGLAAAVVTDIDKVLDGVARWFDGRQARHVATPDDRRQMLGAIDRALAAVTEDGVIAAGDRMAGRQALLGLVGIRRGLFPDAGPYASPFVARRQHAVAAE